MDTWEYAQWQALINRLIPICVAKRHVIVFNDLDVRIGVKLETIDKILGTESLTSTHDLQRKNELPSHQA